MTVPPICHLGGPPCLQWAATTEHVRSRSGVMTSGLKMRALLTEIATDMENDPTCSGRDLMLVANLLETLERNIT